MENHPDRECRAPDPAGGPEEEPDRQVQQDPARAGSVRSIVLLDPDRDVSGRAVSELNLRYSRAEMDRVPMVHQAGSVEDAVREVFARKADLLIVLLRDDRAREDTHFEKLGGILSDTRIAYIFHKGDEGTSPGISNGSDLPYELRFSGDPNLIPQIVQVMEDRIFLDSRGPDEGYSHVIMVSISDHKERSAALKIAADAVWDHMVRLIGIPSHTGDRTVTISRRPRIIVTGDLEISATGISTDRITLLVTDREEKKGDPESRRKFVWPGSGEKALREMVELSISSGPVFFTTMAGGSIGPVHDIVSMAALLKEVPDELLSGRTYGDRIRPWLIGQTEFEIARELDVSFEHRDEITLKNMGEVISGQLASRESKPIIEFSRGLFEHEDFSKIGNGQLGGKGRGLAFLKKILSEMDLSRYRGLDVRVPRTVIIATDVFDLFLRINGLDRETLSSLDDERIIEVFLRSDLPSTIAGDIRHFADAVRSPVVVRSSSLLEDALLQPFAGIYASVMLSNSSIELDKRFKHISMGIKYVYSSTFHSRARSYLDSTGGAGNQEKMAVIIEEIVGQKHGDLYYPSFSGVARSFDYWPFHCCESSDGTVNIAVGLGKMIVDGGSSYKFCPKHPRACFTGSPSESIRQSQRRFYALKKGTNVRSNEFSEDVQIVMEDMATAERDGVLDALASTYSVESDRLYPGIGRDGPRVIDFAPVLQMGTIPLAPFIDNLLEKAEGALGMPVEIEFAVNVDPADQRKAKIFLLQLRGMRGRSSVSSVSLEDIDNGSIIARSSRTLGDGTFHLGDVVMVKGNSLEARVADAIVGEISKLNSTLSREGRQYLLIGPGRWGSCDPWLGIPVSWNDISGVGIIAERPVGERSIDPSQGSHFFQNISSFQLGFMTFSRSEDGDADWDRLVSGSEVVEGEHVIHMRPHSPVRVIIDGSRGVGVVQMSGDVRVGRELT